MARKVGRTNRKITANILPSDNNVVRIGYWLLDAPVASSIALFGINRATVYRWQKAAVESPHEWIRSLKGAQIEDLVNKFNGFIDEGGFSNLERNERIEPTKKEQREAELKAAQTALANKLNGASLPKPERPNISN